MGKTAVAEGELITTDLVAAAAEFEITRRELNRGRVKQDKIPPMTSLGSSELEEALATGAMP